MLWQSSQNYFFLNVIRQDKKKLHMTEITMQLNLNMLQNKPLIMQKCSFILRVSFNPDLSLSGGAVESEVLSLEVAVQCETVKNQSGVWRGRLGVLLLICKHTKNESKYEMSKIKFPLCEHRVCLFLNVSLYLALDAAEVHQVEVAGEDGLEGSKGL